MKQSKIMLSTFEDFDKDINKNLLDSSLLDITDTAIRAIESGASVNIKNNIGRTALHNAAMNGNKVIVEALIKYGANVDMTDDDGKTPIMVAAYYNNIDVLKLLGTKAKNIKALDSDGEDALFSAASGYNFDDKILKLLLNTYGFNSNLRNKEGNTPLFKALIDDNDKLVKKLVDNGADPHSKNNSGKSLEDYARKMNKKKIISFYDSINK
jgi:ankyrin repeat protein